MHVDISSKILFALSVEMRYFVLFPRAEIKLNQIVYVRSLWCNTDYTCININFNALDQVALCIRARGSCIRRMKVGKIQLKKQKQFQSTLLSGGDVIIVISSGHNHFWISVSSFMIG